MKRRRFCVEIMAFSGAMAATSMQRSVWVRRLSQERWDRDVNSFS